MHWGETCLIDAAGISNAKLANFPHVLEFITLLPAAIGMQGYGRPQIERFGRRGEREYGLTAVQLLTTSHCALHACETVGELYLDITSCRTVDPEIVSRFIRHYFGDDIEIRVRHLKRDPLILATSTTA